MSSWTIIYGCSIGALWNVSLGTEGERDREKERFLNGLLKSVYFMALMQEGIIQKTLILK